MDTLLNFPGGYVDPATDLFNGYQNIPGLGKLFNDPTAVQLYYQNILDLANTVFAPANFNPMIEQAPRRLGADGRHLGAESSVAARRTNAVAQVPHGALTAVSALTVQNGYPHSTVSTYALTGTANAAATGSVLVEGHLATLTQKTGAWSYSGTGLAPGLNRLTVQAYSGGNGTGTLVDTTTIDLWYDSSATNDYPKNPVGGGGGGATLPDPTPTSLSLVVPTSYLPGTPIFVDLEALTAAGATATDLWNGTATLSSSNPSVTLSTTSVPMLSGRGSAMVTMTGSGNFTLTASVNGLSATRWLTDLTGTAMTAVSGTLSGALLNWSGIVHVTGNVIVPTGSTLTIQPGTLVLIDGAASGTSATTITVQGSIQSLGTAASPVTITADNASQAWGEIIHNNAAASLYQYTFISHAGNSPPLGHTDTGPAVYPINSTIDFEHSAITDNVGKIMYAQGSNLTFNDTVLARSIMGPEVTATAITVEDCFINEMRSPNDSDGIYLWNQQAGQTIAISDTVIAGVDDDCIDQLGASMTVSGCILRDSKDKGISQYNGEIWVTNTLAIDNARQPEDGSQAAFSMKGDSGLTVKMHLDHVTIYNNSTNGIGIQCRNKYGVPVVYFDYYVTNSIIDAPRPVQSDYTDTYATINVSYTDTYGDMSAGTVGATVHGTGDVNLDPLFVDLTNRNFHLQATSPCVDTGDPAYALDPDATRTDMGGRTYDHGTASVPTGSLTADTVWTAAGGPYRVFGALTVPAGITLTIQPGASVFFENNCSLVVQGRMVANGTALLPILFTRKPGTTGWYGIQFQNSMSDNQLSYALVDYARTANGAVGLQGSNLLIDHVTFDHTDLLPHPHDQLVADRARLHLHRHVCHRPGADHRRRQRADLRQRHPRRRAVRHRRQHLRHHQGPQRRPRLHRSHAPEPHPADPQQHFQRRRRRRHPPERRRLHRGQYLSALPQGHLQHQQQPGGRHLRGRRRQHHRRAE